ncbi:hypothetical protein GGTG_04214 [Gaeumannomyces tritici R3-111a-1]|uniref:Uncharacterized protein n=1 Tax=Gaeumannomyces tritici (strain R3-111a-1) TaxID=644352 RepID=J3NSG2_GAET3|nr:hypothetical protein GGTG_04214 [Gaeumannomyces tritici R3-111a-1]EJT79125.1 hypothetical protein GGTG_04214 [Gaeumannomyces tritici R3-111a-1]
MRRGRCAGNVLANPGMLLLLTRRGGGGTMTRTIKEARPPRFQQLEKEKEREDDNEGDDEEDGEEDNKEGPAIAPALVWAVVVGRNTYPTAKYFVPSW